MEDLASAISGAADSIWIMSSNELLRRSGLDDGALQRAKGSLDLRCLLNQREFSEGDLDPFPGLDVFSIYEPLPDDSAATSDKWQYRWLNGESTEVLLLIDAAHEFLIEPGQPSRIRHKSRPSSSYVAFEEAWERATPVGEIYTSEFLETDDETDTNPVIGAVPRWREFLAEIHKDPAALRRLTPRQFEELVAELLDKDGYNVKLTRFSKDKGIDIIATRKRLVQEMYLVQCKHPKVRPVSVDVVRNLYGVVNRDRATAGVVVTSGRLTADAVKECNQCRYKMGFKEYEELMKWIADVVRNKGMHQV